MVKDTADKKAMIKEANVDIDEAVNIADERRKERNQGDDEGCTLLNAVFQEIARKST